MRVQCCVVGGGPAGMMLGYLLARQGIEVAVLEKHKDFLRDFRGDTVHASTLEALHDLGLLDRFLLRPHQAYDKFAINIEGERLNLLNFASLPTHCKFVAFMPQWEFLDFLADEAARFPSFHLMMESEATSLIWESDRVIGVRTQSQDVLADLVVGCDGRHSVVRACAGLHVEELGVPIDVLWTRIEKTDAMPGELLAYASKGRFLVLIDRGDYFQAGYLIAKGSFGAIKDRGIEQFRRDLAEVAPFLSDTIDNMKDWEQVKLLTVQIDRLESWCLDGLVCIGDAAHAMSPMGGVGINLAIQDAIATSNAVLRELSRGRVKLETLQDVQRRRVWPTKVLQTMQAAMHRRFLRPGGISGLSRVLRFASRIPAASLLLARLIGMGPRMERIVPVNEGTEPADIQ